MHAETHGSSLEPGRSVFQIRGAPEGGGATQTDDPDRTRFADGIEGQTNALTTRGIGHSRSRLLVGGVMIGVE